MPGPTEVRRTTPDGRRRLSDEQRARISATQKARFAALPPERQAEIRDRLRALNARPPAGPSAPAPPAAAPEGGAPRSPLDDAPGAPRGARPSDRTGDRLRGRVGAPPLFVVPDLPPPPEGGEVPVELVDEGPAFAVTTEQVETLLRFPFRFLAVRRGEHWRLRDDEAEMVAEPLARKLNEHAAAARAIAAGGDWLVIGGGLALIVWSRLEEDAQRAERSNATGRSSGRAPEQDDRGPRDGDRGRDAARPGAGFLNGFAFVGVPRGAGAAPAADTPAVPAEDPFGAPLQAL